MSNEHIYKNYTLSTICDFNKCSLSKRDSFDTIEYLDTSNITENNIETLVTYTVKNAPVRAKRKVNDKTIIYSTVRPIQKHFGIMENPDNNMIVSTGFITIDLKREYRDIICEYYLYYLITQNSVTAYLQTIAEGSVSSYPSITSEDIMQLNFPFPEMDYQKKIATFLMEIDSKIKLNNLISLELEKMAKTLYNYWFVQYDFPDENGKPYKSSGGKMVWNEELGKEIPEGWKVKKIKDILDVITGKEDVNFTTTNGIYPFFSCSKETLKCDKYEYDGYAILIAGNGDFNVKAYVGKFNAYQRTYVLMINDIKYFAAIYHACNNKIISFKKGSNGAIIKFIKKSDVENVDILIPDNEDILDYLNDLLKKKLHNIIQNQELANLRDFLLPLLMNGQAKIE